MNKEEPKVLTRMRLSCCWGDNLSEKELNEVVDYINSLQQENKELKENRDKAIEILERIIILDLDNDQKACDILNKRDKELLQTLKGDYNE